ESRTASWPRRTSGSSNGWSLRRLTARGLDRATDSRRQPLLPSRQAEVHVVLVARPVPTPVPADGCERLDHRVPRMDHARLVQRAVPEWLGVVVPHVAVGRYVRVLDGVDVD